METCRVGDGIAPLCKVEDGGKLANYVEGKRALYKTTEFNRSGGVVGDGRKEAVRDDMNAGEYEVEANEKSDCEAGRPRNLATNAVDLDLGYDEVHDANAQDWVSPRVSFSQDFIMSADRNSLVSQSSVPREGKREEHDMRDNYSAEFEFLKSGPGYNCAADQANKGFMLSAEELFFDGKLLPQPFASCVWATSDDLSGPLSCVQHTQEATVSLQAIDQGRPSTRNLSFETPKSSSSLSSSLRSKCACISLPISDSDAHILSPSSLQLPLPSTASPSTTTSRQPSLVLSSMSLKPLTSSSVAKCSTKFKEFFQIKRLSKDLEVTRGSTSETTCRPPISSRTFWPFSRSKSACESKTLFPAQTPCRSNSAGGSHSCGDLSLTDIDAFDTSKLNTSCAVGPSKAQGFIISACEENPFTVLSKPSVVMPSLDEGASVWNPSNDAPDTCSAAAVDDGSFLGSRSSSKKASVKRIKGPSDSPGRSRDSSGTKANGGKLVPRNLEQCSADQKKLGREVAWKGLNRRGSFPVGARVSPVLNVAVYRGSVSLGLVLCCLPRKRSPQTDSTSTETDRHHKLEQWGVRHS